MKTPILMLVSALILLSATVCPAATTFTWDANTETDVAGYRIYLKHKATGEFTKLGGDVMGRTTISAVVTIPEVKGLDEFTVVATAFDLVGNESDKSSEATKDGAIYIWKDVTPPLAPSMLQVLQLIADTLQRIAVALENR